MKKYRPLGFKNPYSEENYRELPFAKRGVEPHDIEWTLEDCEIGFEAGADAMLEGLRNNQWCPFDTDILSAGRKCKVVVIPNDE